MIALLRRKFWKAYVRIRWGEVHCRVASQIDWIVCEEEWYSIRTGKVVGYWAYGHWDPWLPYRGQDL